MVLSLGDFWYQNMDASGDPRFIVTINAGPICYLLVNNYAAAVGGDTFTLTIDGVDYVFTAVGGTPGAQQFNVGGSNQSTANDIARSARTSLIGPLYAGVTASNIVAFISPGATSLRISATSNSTAWYASPQEVPASLSWVSGATPLYGYMNSVSEISPIASRIDVVTREASVGSFEIVFADDGSLRELIVRSKLKGKTVTISLGCPSLTANQYAPVGIGVIDDIIPARGQITIRCVEPLILAKQAKVRGSFICMHPLAVMRKVLQLINFPTSIYDNTSLESTDSRYAAIANWATTRHSWYPIITEFPSIVRQPPFASNAMTESAEAFTIISEMAMLLNGGFRPDEIGMHAMHIYDPNAAIVRTLGDADIDDFLVEQTLEVAVNKVNIGGVDTGNFSATSASGVNAASNAQRAYIWSMEDVLSERLLALEGAAQTVFETNLASNWIGVPLYTIFTILQTDTTILLTGDPTLCGFTGTRPSSDVVQSNGSYHFPSQRSADQLSVSHPAYLLITDGSNYEVVQATGFAWVDANIQLNDQVGDLNNGYPQFTYQEPTYATPLGPAVFWRQCEFTVVRNPVDANGIPYGPAAREWIFSTGGTQGPYKIRVYDITAALSVASARMSRFSNGCPIARLTTHIGNYDLQLGDFISVTNDIYINFQNDGADGNTVFEIIGKELKILDDKPCVEFQIAWVRDQAVFASSVAYAAPPITQYIPTTTTYDFVTDNNDIPTTSLADDFITRN